MSKMSYLDIEINDLLNNTKFMIDEIANILNIPEKMVEDVVAARWEKIVEMDLSADEQAAFNKSADAVRNMNDVLKTL